MVVTAPTSGVQDGGSRVELVSAVSTLKMLSLFGNRASLQDEVNKVLAADANTRKLTIYKTVAKFATDAGM